ncbi:VWA domain-containing protein [bacterium]|nr:VWA domain-containing protein [bacterium]
MKFRHSGFSLLIPVLLFSLLALTSPLFAQDPVNVNVVGFNSNYFPQIHLYVQVTDAVNEPIIGLIQDDFEVNEDGAIASFDVRPFLVEGTSFGMALDCSGSMSGQYYNVVSACTTFVSNMRPLDNAAVIFFEDYYDTRVMQTMTNDHALANNAIAQYDTSGGTAMWYGYYKALEQCQEELLPRVIIGFTDGNDNSSGSYTIDTVALFARALGCPVFTIGLGSVNPAPLIQIAEMTDGQYIHTTPDSLIYYYAQIQHAYQNMYEIAYISPNPVPNGANRVPEVWADWLGDNDSDTTSYISPWVLDFAPRITLTPYVTDTLMVNSQPAATPLTIKAWITDNDGLSLVRLKHRSIGATVWNYGAMVNVSDSLWTYTLEDWYVQDPGIEFYILAIDNYLHVVNAPQYNPGQYPYQVHVQPNVGPQITHNPISSWPAGIPLTLSCEVEDQTNTVANVEMFFRKTTDIFPIVIALTNTGGNTWEGTINGDQLTEQGDLIYFLRAWDDYGAYMDHGEHYIDVTPGTITATLTPLNPPILIPASGGSFDFNILLENVSTSQATCDAWISVMLPDSSTFGPLLGPATLNMPGGAQIDRDRSQVIPANAPAGTYIYHLFVGNHPDEIWTSSDFTFEKLTTGDGASYASWENYGEPLVSESSLSSDLLPDGYQIDGFYPNPFNPTTAISIQLSAFSHVNLSVYDITGRKVAELVDGWRDAGIHEVTFDASGLASGVYLYQVQIDAESQMGKIVLMK